ncbi:MAG: crossover junction endodeoxyribonuclease RuvC, partial [Candidatus Cloacimonadota bacterium]
MRILGIDPGSQNCGYGILEIENRKIVAAGCDVIRMKPSLPLTERLVTVYTEIKKIVEEYKPDLAAVETIFYGENVKSAFSLGHVRGVILLALAENNIKIMEFSPREVKKSVVGNGNAYKEQVEYMVKRILKIEIDKKTRDATDALANAL